MADVPMYQRGLSVWKPREKAPEWVKADLVFDVAAFTEFLEANATGDGKVRVQIKESRAGKFYAEHDTYKRAESVGVTMPDTVPNPDDVPF